MTVFKNALVASAIAAVLCCTAAAQNYQAQITGVVNDSSSAAVPNAHVVVTNIATGAKSSTDSNAQGLYRVLALPPAQYRITVTGTGFKTFEQGPITLQANDVVTLD